jgi:NADH-quinone oxidoreductase subunit C
MTDQANGTMRAFGERVAAALPGAVSAIHVDHDELTISVSTARLLETIAHLRDDADCLFVCLIDITAVDYPTRAERFDVVYHFLSPKYVRRIRVKCAVDEDGSVPSLVDLFPAADWFERETWDMFGVLFSGHPDLRRLLTDYGFEGHPLRKDFPMTGYVEVRWDDDQKRVVYEPVRLTQEYRRFDFLSPWEGASPYELPGDEKASGGPE